MSALALIAQLESEMRGMLMKEKELQARVRGVRRVLRGVKQMANNKCVPASNSPDSFPGDIAATSPVPKGLTLQPRQLSKRRIRLQRACRIALLEVDASANLEEIYARIVARESFSFAKVEDPLRILEKEFEAMARHGEIRLSRSSMAMVSERLPTRSEENLLAQSTVNG